MCYDSPNTFCPSEPSFTGILNFQKGPNFGVISKSEYKFAIALHFKNVILDGKPISSRGQRLIVARSVRR